MNKYLKLTLSTAFAFIVFNNASFGTEGWVSGELKLEHEKAEIENRKDLVVLPGGKISVEKGSFINKTDSSSSSSATKDKVSLTILDGGELIVSKEEKASFVNDAEIDLRNISIGNMKLIQGTIDQTPNGVLRVSPESQLCETFCATINGGTVLAEIAVVKTVTNNNIIRTNALKAEDGKKMFVVVGEGTTFANKIGTDLRLQNLEELLKQYNSKGFLVNSEDLVTNSISYTAVVQKIPNLITQEETNTPVFNIGLIGSAPVTLGKTADTQFTVGGDNSQYTGKLKIQTPTVIFSGAKTLPENVELKPEAEVQIIYSNELGCDIKVKDISVKKGTLTVNAGRKLIVK